MLKFRVHIDFLIHSEYEIVASHALYCYDRQPTYISSSIVSRTLLLFACDSHTRGARSIKNFLKIGSVNTKSP